MTDNLHPDTAPDDDEPAGRPGRRGRDHVEEDPMPAIHFFTGPEDDDDEDDDP